MRFKIPRRIHSSGLVAAGAMLVSQYAVGQTPEPLSWVFETSTRPIRVVTLADGLASPWAFEFLPNGDILLSERPGKLRVYRNGALVPEPIAGVPEVRYRLHGGLLDVALHPEFERNGIIYLSYSKTVLRDGEEGGTTAVFRARLDGGQLVEGRDIFVADAWTPLDVNFGSRIAFAPDGKMFVSVGDRGPNGESLAQDLTVHNGKILRLNDDGSVPDDNPFVGKLNARPEIYSYGHRNPQGFTIHPETGQLWASEHGPLGGDEVNIILPGANYGWPIVSFGRKYDGSVITQQPWREGMEPPRFYWVPSIGISGLQFYTANIVPEWQGELFVTGMSGMMIQRVRMQGRGTAERESLLTPLRRQFRDIQQGPDGLLYVLARADANRNENTGSLLRIEPAGPAENL
jgi:glucose/arabinose dehydrogenase